MQKIRFKKYGFFMKNIRFWLDFCQIFIFYACLTYFI